MNKSEYQMLRYAVEVEVGNVCGVYPNGDADLLVSSIMRLFLQSINESARKTHAAKRKFLTFRRNPENIAPSWALHNPGISSRLPTL